VTKVPKARTILIIEDEADVRSFASRVLELEGYQVLSAENGGQGLELLKQGNISVVLLDLRLPVHDGWWVLTQMKDEQNLSGVAIIVFTASAGVPQRIRALSMGVDKYLVKPLSAASLKEAVASVLHQREEDNHATKESICTGG